MSTKTKRIVVLDVLRGFALIGILLVNLYSFNIYYGLMHDFYSEFTGINHEIFDVVMHFFGGKSMFLFAFLFGYGAWIQFNNHQDFNQFKSYWNRRMVILFGIGVLHILLLTFGDILAAYAVLGLLVPLLIRKNNKALLLLFLGLQLIPVIEYELSNILEYSTLFSPSKYTIDQYININTSSNFWEIFKLRLYDFFTFRNEKIITYMPKELSLFLLGIVSARMNLIQKSYAKKGIIFCVFGWAIAILYYLKSDSLWALFYSQESIFQTFLVGLTFMLKETIHGLCYVLTFFILWNFKIFRTITSFLQYLGKMALTNYLMQSVLAVFIYSGLGLGLYGQSSPLDLLIYAVGILIFQWLFSYYWLRHFQFGPIEGIWRKLTRKNK